MYRQQSLSSRQAAVGEEVGSPDECLLACQHWRFVCFAQAGTIGRPVQTRAIKRRAGSPALRHASRHTGIIGWSPEFHSSAPVSVWRNNDRIIIAGIGWLGEGLHNPAARRAIGHAGPPRGLKLSLDDVRAVHIARKPAMKRAASGGASRETRQRNGLKAQGREKCNVGPM